MHLPPAHRLLAVGTAVLVLGALLGVAPGPPAGAGAATFSDVPPDHPFFVEIEWLAGEGIADGYPDGTFRPVADVSRQALVAFLARQEEAVLDPPGQPTFPDVPAHHPFFAEIEWAAGEGIVQGYADGRFRPSTPVSRQATAAFLFRVEGAPAGDQPEGGFADVPGVHPFRDEISWLADQGVINGFDDCTFRGGSTLTRQAVAAFLYRLGADVALPRLRLCTPVEGIQTGWDLAFTPDDVGLFTVRQGQLVARFRDGALQPVFVDLGDLYSVGETGLMGLAVDPAFASNRRIYTCQGVDRPGGGGGIQVVAWAMASDYTSAVRVADPLVGDAGWEAAGNGRHGGCRLRIDGAGSLWISTGDAARGTNPQDLSVLNGKVLRVSPATGAAWPGNPFAADGDPATDARVVTYGHRNVQGLALRPATGEVWTVEHGPGTDDEVNVVESGGNYGWNPVPGYNEAVPMTDTAEFPDAVEARWSSGFPTVAPSGATWLEGERWGAWEGALAVACLKNQEVRVQSYDGAGAFQGEQVPPELDGITRLRQPVQGPGGVLYVVGDGQIVQVVPTAGGPT